MLNKSIKLLPLPPCTPVPFKLNFTSECFLSALHKIYGLIFFLERRFINCTCLRSAFLTDQKTPNPLCNAKPPYLVHYSSGDKRVRGIIRKTPIPDSITEHKYSWFIFFFLNGSLCFPAWWYGKSTVTERLTDSGCYTRFSSWLVRLMLQAMLITMFSRFGSVART